jgi:hypothetical protein
MSETEDGGTLASPEEATGESRVEVIDVQATVGKYLQALVDDPGLQRVSSCYVPVRLVPASDAGAGSQGDDGGGEPGSQAPPASIPGRGSFCLVDRAVARAPRFGGWRSSRPVVYSEAVNSSGRPGVAGPSTFRCTWNCRHRMELRGYHRPWRRPSESMSLW